MIRVVVNWGGGHRRLWGICARCRGGGTRQVTWGSKAPIRGSSRSTRREVHPEMREGTGELGWGK